ncbi:MFS transporter [Pediococcus acidilactici]|jgi:inositol transporter-like SP family MFS transporter|uniref:MFS transporter n=1 Tax=Pediococcus acidilactici TaxID=1254 RepID=UPI00029E069A|nr:MFS transporter [Pediococcus acidilactici]GAC45963.1 MFS transporter, SP family, inositol transporter [Pediococcus acidilactici NGRI 0510Q]APR28187.1 MFS transporter [Pediococcus acidilactici]KRN90057.1 MFS transporter, SP family, inositol transporter [Pediococcus acidilactici]MBS9398760.1 MFS transporter [Pediococcus acidilactici]MCH9267379.1 MFS transporter [Pediococcus acidilactici]
MSEEQGSVKSTIAVSITNFLDSGSIVAGASGLTFWTKELGLSSFQVGLLGALSANAFGSAIGALIGGHLSDKFGRKVIYTYDMLVYMLGTAIIAFSINFPMLLAGFLITGIAVGAGVPASWTYISETSGSTDRAKNIGISQFAWSMGPAIIFIAGTILAPIGLLGNRLLFIFLTIVAFIAWRLQSKLEESQVFEEQKQAEKDSGITSHPYKDLFSNMVNIKSLLFLIGVYMFWNLVAGAMGFFMPYVYETVGGLTNMQANLLQAVLWILTALGTYVGFAKFGDRANHRIFYFVGAAMAAASWIVLTYAGMNWTSLWLFVILWGVSAGIGAQAWYALWATELFPTRYRAGSQGVMFFVVRGSAGIWSIIFPTILTSMGFKAAGTFMIALLIVSLVIGTVWTPHTRGKSLEQISKERYGNDQD